MPILHIFTWANEKEEDAGIETEIDVKRQVVGDIVRLYRQRTDGSNYKTCWRVGVEQLAESGQSDVPFWNRGQAELVDCIN